MCKNRIDTGTGQRELKNLFHNVRIHSKRQGNEQSTQKQEQSKEIHLAKSLVQNYQPEVEWSKLSRQNQQLLKNKDLSSSSRQKITGPSVLAKADECGHFLYGDQVACILDSHSKSKSQRPEDMLMLIKWQRRTDGSCPADSLLSLTDFEYFNPLQAQLYMSSQEQEIA